MRVTTQKEGNMVQIEKKSPFNSLAVIQFGLEVFFSLSLTTIDVVQRKIIKSFGNIWTSPIHIFNISLSIALLHSISTYSIIVVLNIVWKRS